MTKARQQHSYRIHSQVVPTRLKNFGGVLFSDLQQLLLVQPGPFQLLLRPLCPFISLILLLSSALSAAAPGKSFSMLHLRFKMHKPVSPISPLSAVASVPQIFPTIPIPALSRKVLKTLYKQVCQCRSIKTKLVNLLYGEGDLLRDDLLSYGLLPLL